MFILDTLPRYECEPHKVTEPSERFLMLAIFCVRKFRHDTPAQGLSTADAIPQYSLAGGLALAKSSYCIFVLLVANVRSTPTPRNANSSLYWALSVFISPPTQLKQSLRER